MDMNWGKPTNVFEEGQMKVGREIMVAEPKVLEVVDNRIYFYAEIDRETILTLNRTLRRNMNDLITRKKLEECDSCPPIFLHIQSYGGSVFSGLAGMDQILQIKKDIPVHTVVDGCCASAATFISVVGTKRYINPNAFMLIHQLSSGMWGKYAEFKDEMQNLDMLMEKIKVIYAKYTKIPPAILDEIMKHDLWLSPEKCVEYGLVDEILKS